jgi:hypothetical protein
MKTALSRAEQGERLDSIAKHLGVAPLRALRLIERGHDLREMAAIEVPRVDTSMMRDLFSAWQAKDPSAHTYLELARRADLDSASTVQRLLGVIPNARVVKGNKVYPGKVRTTISTEMGGRLARAMGYVPAEIEGL